MIVKKKNKRKITIDLTGPDGNSFVLLGAARNFCRQLGYSQDETQKVFDDMMSGDYENLIKVFDRNFGTFVILER